MNNFNYEKYSEYLKATRKFNGKKDGTMEDLSSFYAAAKEFADALYVRESEETVSYYDDIYLSGILSNIYRAEDTLKNQYITSPRTTPIDALNTRDINDTTTHENILNAIALEANTCLYKTLGFMKNYQKSAGKLDLSDKCDKSAIIVKKICDELNIKCIVQKIEAGFQKDSTLLDGSGYHYFNIIILDGKRYLMDLTYQQFFMMNNNNLDRLGTPLLTGCAPGVYMNMDASRLKTAKQILGSYWIEATDENLKHYFDGFALSYRNALYYENMPTRVFTTDYTATDYLNFLDGKDSQINHETEECLGFQLRPLKK